MKLISKNPIHKLPTYNLFNVIIYGVIPIYYTASTLNLIVPFIISHL